MALLPLVLLLLRCEGTPLPKIMPYPEKSFDYLTKNGMINLISLFCSCFIAIHCQSTMKKLKVLNFKELIDLSIIYLKQPDLVKQSKRISFNLLKKKRFQILKSSHKTAIESSTTAQKPNLQELKQM